MRIGLRVDRDAALRSPASPAISTFSRAPTTCSRRIGRALGVFKDPNVFGPFLIWPALFVIERMLTRRIGCSISRAVGILLFGLLLSFSRGAWFHFAVSCAS